MSVSRNETWNKLARLGLAAQLALLVLAVAATAAPLLALAYRLSGNLGIVAALTAAAVCLTGGMLALTLNHFLARRLEPLQAVLVSMMVRMAVPLVLGLAAYLIVPTLAGAGMFFYFLAFYGVVLAVETVFSVAHLPASVPTSPKAT